MWDLEDETEFQIMWMWEEESEEQTKMCDSVLKSEEKDQSLKEDEQVVGEKLLSSVVIGQMSIACDHVELYRRLIDKFGEIVSENLPIYKVEPTNAALTSLLNTVKDMLNATPETICQEKVVEWKEMTCFYSGVGLKVEWLQERLDRCGDWLARQSTVDVKKLEFEIQVKRNVLEGISKVVCNFQRELQELTAELDRVRDDPFCVAFSFF